MMKAIRWLGVALLFVSGAVTAGTTLPGPLVGGDWLLSQKDSKDLVLLDIQDRKGFLQHHIPGAVNWPFSYWRTSPKSRPPVSIPSQQQLTERLGRLGISRDTPLVIVTTGAGAGDMASAARAYWTLAVLGHEQMAILNGGLVSYVNEYKGSYVSGNAEPREPTTYAAKPNRSLLVMAEQIHKGLDQPLLDARSQGEYVGLSGGAKGRSGTIPGAHNLSFDWLVDDSGKVRNRQAVQKLFAFAGVPKGGAVHFCQTGHRGAMTWFADYALLGNRNAKLYDGSMMEWAADPSLPLEKKLDL